MRKRNFDQRVGIAGIGLVGTAIAERLTEEGYEVTGYDIRPERMEALRLLGGSPAPSVSVVAQQCDRLILSLPSSTVTATVLEEIAQELKAGSIVIDTTTGSPEDAALFSEKLNLLGVDYLDATIGGSSGQVRTQDALIICGGDRDAFERCLDVFNVCSSKIYYLGQAGSGARMKLVLHLVLGLHRAVLAEGLEFARASGIDPALALDILKAGPAWSRAMDTKGERMLNEEFDPEARLSQHLKDVRLILDWGEKTEAKLPLSAVHRELLESAEAAGFGAADNSAIIKSFQKPIACSPDR